MEGSTIKFKDRTDALHSLSYLYDLIRDYGVSPASIRTHFFNRVGFPKVSLGEDHKKGCLEFAAKMKVDEIAETYEKLSDHLESYILNNNKLVSFFDVTPAAANDIVFFFKQLVASNTDGEMFLAYPGLPDSVEDVSEDLDPVKVIEISNDKCALLLGSKRVFHKLIKLDKDDIKEGVFDENANISDVTAKGLVSELAIDVIVLDKKKNRLEIRLSNAVRMAKSNRLKFVNKLKLYVYKNMGVDLGQAYNFFDRIRPLYFEGDTGFITKLDFLTDEGIERNERSNFDRKGIRGELYHEHGANSIGHDFQAFSIRKVWSAGDAGGYKYKIKLDIPGGVRLLSTGFPEIDHIFLLDCYTHSDYNFLINKALP